ncbi:conserved exported protein of unknown function [Limnospira indica PCC 8005]|uniref:Secreted protein n=1 Tax=Limnospira indica PCC 8005 TaxID=376219 RepID=A0A9P1KAK6_9CYAN|nr:conserved exported protein of unknown function [Limnospira indica PCC 8005]
MRRYCASSVLSCSQLLSSKAAHWNCTAFRLVSTGVGVVVKGVPSSRDGPGPLSEVASKTLLPWAASPLAVAIAIVVLPVPPLPKNVRITAINDFLYGWRSRSLGKTPP